MEMSSAHRCADPGLCPSPTPAAAGSRASRWKGFRLLHCWTQWALAPTRESCPPLRSAFGSRKCPLPAELHRLCTRTRHPFLRRRTLMDPQQAAVFRSLRLGPQCHHCRRGPAAPRPLCCLGDAASPNWQKSSVKMGTLDARTNQKWLDNLHQVSVTCTHGS